MTQKKTFDIMMHDHNKMYEQHVVGACRSSAGLLLHVVGACISSAGLLLYVVGACRSSAGLLLYVVGACRSSAGLLLYDITVDYLHLTFIQC
jgi:hypothetical protein